MLPEGPWFVPSATQAGVFWRVDFGDTPATGLYWLCTCPAGRARDRMAFGEQANAADFGRPCHHVRLVAAAEREDGHQPRPRPEMGDLSRFYE